MPRRIIYHPEFDGDCAVFGGIAAVQPIIDPLVNALETAPDLGVFSLLSVDTGFRYARLRSVGAMPELVAVFVEDEDGDIVMRALFEYK
jgi:hypothetical protein